MEENEWTPAYPTTTKPLPTMDTPLNFYLRCETHRVQIDSMTSLNMHASLHNLQKRMRCDWMCGHCLHTFHSCTQMRRHLSLFSVRMGYAKTAEFATSQMVHKPYFRRKSHVFPPTTLQILASNASTSASVPRYNALSSCHPHDIAQLATEAAELKQTLGSQTSVHFSPISPIHIMDSHSTELSSLPISSQPLLLSKDSSSHPSKQESCLHPVVDAAPTTCTYEQTSKTLSHLQDTRVNLSHTLNFQCALLLKHAPTALSSLEQSMLQQLLSHNILPMPFVSMYSANTTEVAQRISDFNMGSSHFKNN